MCTALFSHEGKYRASIKSVPNKEDDGFHYIVDVTGKSFDSEKKAIRHARSWLRKKRRKYYKKNPKKWVKRTRRIPKEERHLSPIKTLHKLYKMKKKTAQILVKHSDKKLKIKLDYSRKKWDKSTTAVSGETSAFNLAISSVLITGTEKERKSVSKMLVKFTHEPFRKTNMFY